nr:hypothetical protein [uncultured Gellertiella sp.]
MAGLRAVYLAPEEVEKIVAPLLKEDFAAYHFRGKSIQEDETFDGDPIIRVRAEVGEAVPAAQLIQTLTRIHDALRRQNDERLVFLSAPGPNAVSPEDQGDEDVD